MWLVVEKVKVKNPPIGGGGVYGQLPASASDVSATLQAGAAAPTASSAGSSGSISAVPPAANPNPNTNTNASTEVQLDLPEVAVPTHRGWCTVVTRADIVAALVKCFKGTRLEQDPALVLAILESLSLVNIQLTCSDKVRRVRRVGHGRERE